MKHRHASLDQTLDESGNVILDDTAAGSSIAEIGGVGRNANRDALGDHQ